MRLHNNNMCPKCFRHGNLGKLCPACGTELFELGGTFEPPRKGSKGWKTLSQNKSVKHYIDIYNANPVEDWLTQHSEEVSFKCECDNFRSALAAHRKLRKKAEASPTITVHEMVAVKDRVVYRPYDPKCRSVWFFVRVSSYYGSTFNVYNGQTMANVNIDLAADVYGARIGSRHKPGNKLKRQLDAAIRKFVQPDVD